MRRTKAIFNALYFGVLPYRFYERQRHYSCSYWQHLLINLRLAYRWATWQEDQSDRDFEKEVNKNE